MQIQIHLLSLSVKNLLKRVFRCYTVHMFSEYGFLFEMV